MIGPRALLDLAAAPIVGRRRQRRMVGLYSSFAGRGDLCFDIGANIGDRTAVLRAIGARVVAVEPQDDCVAALRARFASDPDVTIVTAGLADSEGIRELRRSTASTLSSMAPDWIDSVRASGRFSEFEWSDPVEVPVVTLESVIAEHGRPRFCKIDVEGYELEVLKGLRSPIEALSFEYAHEERGRAFACMTRLNELGDYEFCFSPAESMDLGRGWFGADEQVRALEGLEGDLPWGDVYARVSG